MSADYTARMIVGIRYDSVPDDHKASIDKLIDDGGLDTISDSWIGTTYAVGIKLTASYDCGYDLFIAAMRNAREEFWNLTGLEPRVIIGVNVA